MTETDQAVAGEPRRASASTETAPPEEARTASGGRGLVAMALLRGVLLALGTAGIAAAACGGGLRFLAIWSGLLLPLELILGLLVLPLHGEARRSPRPRAGLIAGAGELGLALLLQSYVPLLRPLGAPFVLLRALIGAGLGAASGGRERPAPAETSGEPDPGFSGARLPGLVLRAAPLLLVAGVIAVADPEARYHERYAENLPRAEAPPATPLYPDRPPAELTPSELIRELAKTWLDTHDPARLRWSWEEAVALEGLVATRRIHNDPRLLPFVRDWLETHREEALEGALWADAAAPALVILALPEVAASPDGRALIARVDRYLKDEAPRTRAGAISHTGLVAGGRLPASAWVDSLFMHGVFLHRLARLRGDPAPLQRARELFEAMSERSGLRDPERGLYRHASLDLTRFGPTVRLPVEDTFWARGNAWVLWFLMDHRATRRGLGLGPDPALESIRATLIGSVLAARDPSSGLWPTDLAAPPGELEAERLESSASALLLAALTRQRIALRRAGAAPDPALTEACQAALAGLRRRLSRRRGAMILSGTSTGTHPGFRAYYRAIPCTDNVGHGIGALLLCLREEVARSAVDGGG